MTLQKMAKGWEAARAWRETRPEPKKTDPQPTSLAWDQPILTLEGLTVMARARAYNESQELYFASGKFNHWIVSLSDVKKGHPWESLLDATPSRLVMRPHHRKTLLLLSEFFPLISKSLLVDPRLAHDADGMRHLLGTGGSFAVLKEPVGFAGMSQLPFLRFHDQSPDLRWSSVPPNWRQQSDDELLSLRVSSPFLPVQVVGV